MSNLLRTMAARLPARWQRTIRRYRFARQIGNGRFGSTEPEYQRLEKLVQPGDWVIDIGANVGHYTLRLAELVGPLGRVFAFEPIPATFELLAANVALREAGNVSLFNVAVSDRTGLTRMEVPSWRGEHLPNYYEARITPDDADVPTGWSALTLPIDALQLPRRVSFVKIDVEGHELPVARGMAALLERDRPVMVVEGDRAAAYLDSLGYRGEHLPGSPNFLWQHAAIG